MGHRPLLAQIEREPPRAAAERSGSQVTAAERRVADLIAGGAADRRRGGAVRLRPAHRDACRLHLPQARRAHLGPSWPGGFRLALSSHRGAHTVAAALVTCLAGAARVRSPTDTALIKASAAAGTSVAAPDTPPLRASVPSVT